MRDDEIQLRIDGHVTLDLLSDALAEFRGALSAAAESRGADIQWDLYGLEFGSATMLARAAPLDDQSSEQVLNVIGDMADASQRAMEAVVGPQRPLQKHLFRLRKLTSQESPITLDFQRERVKFTPLVVSEKDTTQAIPPTTLGTIRGRVEMLSLRQGLHFNLYELIDGCQVKCYPPAELESKIRDVWGHVADVSGSVTRDPETDRPKAIRDISAIDLVAEGDPEGYRAARGVLKTKEPAEKLIRQLRDAP